MANTILSIDCGTQSIRAILFTHDGNLIDKVQICYEPYYSIKPGWAEQDPEIFWNSLCSACLKLKSINPDAFAQIKGVGVTTLRATMINVDEKGIPLRPVITWLDQRKAGIVYFPNPFLKLLLKIIGMKDPLERIQMEGKCNWIKQNEPEIWKRTHKYLQVSGFINFRLTGEFKDSTASQIGHIPFDYKKMKWSAKKGLESLIFPVEKEKLPEIIEPSGIIGWITKKASEATGISEGIPVVACGSDKGCETIGMGVLDQSFASLSFGTTATVQTTTKKYFEPIRFVRPYPASIPGYYNPEVEIFRGYWMITWFKNEFAHKEVQCADEQGVPPEVIMDDLLRESPAGSMGLVLQPYWSPGLKQHEAKGAMIGFGDVHKKAHMYRAVIEGLGYGLLEGLHKIEKAGKVKIKKVAVSGGASQSDEICQISADIFNLTLLRGKTTETSGLGAAIITAVGTGIYPDFKEAMKNMVHYDTEFTPNKDNARIYKELYNRVYLKMYKNLKPLYEEIKDITGYPE